MVVDFTLKNITAAAKDFLLITAGKKIIAFHGEMGAGKTTFIHAICDCLKVKDSVSSPTFSIINEYASEQGNIIYHIDLYRLKNEEEAIQAGVEEVLYSGETCLVEWPEKAPGIFPPATLHCYLTSAGADERKLQINL